MGGYAALNRRELLATTPDWVNIDHRRGTAFAPGEMPALLDVVWNLTTDLSNSIEAVHRLNDLGAVVTNASHETSPEGFDAEWRVITVVTLEGDLVNRCEVFDEADIDAAIARFAELSQPASRLENAAGRVDERIWSYFAARDWDAMAELMADDISTDDRRRVVNAGVLHGRDAEIANMRAVADIDANITSIIIAIRGERLALTRLCSSNLGPRPEEFGAEALNIIEINADNRIVAGVVFDLDDIDAAFEELDARYRAGEAAAHAHAWSLVAEAFAAINRHELPELTSDWVNIDHRRAISFAPGDMTPYIHAIWDQEPDIRVYIEAVHRLTNLGAVVTQAAQGTSQQGFEAEWREINISTVDGDLINRCEIFDEANIDAALARFEELHQQTRRLENAASQVGERFNAYFAARDWSAMAEIMVDDVFADDRRPVVGTGTKRGREANIADIRARADVEADSIASTLIATRGQRIALDRACFLARDGQPAEYLTEMLRILEINDDNVIAAYITFDPGEIDAAIRELDARYLTGEAAAHSHTWSVIAQAYAGFNRKELPPTTPDWVNIDRRRLVTIEEGGLKEYLRATMDATSRFNMHITAVHRLSDLGVVVTHTSHATSQAGIDAEWQDINLMTIDGDLINRCEIFDEADIDAALARFEELHPQMPRPLENAASQVYERCNACFAARDWSAMAETFADDISTDDRRRVVGAGIRHGREALVEITRAIVDLGLNNLTSNVVATRGARLILTRTRFSGPDRASGAFFTDILSVVEINANNRIAAHVVFDPGDRDTAFEELDARYVAGEAAAHAHTWSVIAGLFTALNRRELPKTTPGWVNIDHRRATAFAPGEAIASLRATWDLTPDFSIHIETVHRLNNVGAVVALSAHGTSQEGFYAEWREIAIVTVDGDLISRCEIFDEADLDTAHARFEELHPQARRLENAASQVAERFLAQFAARDWDAMAEILADDYSADDRRRVVNAGIRHGRDAEIANMQTIADLGFTDVTSTVSATRGDRLVLIRTCGVSGLDQAPEAFHGEMLCIIEIDADERVVANVMFDLDDIDAAFEELDARYVAGEAAAHS
jgi:hypothetical protein